MKLTKNVMRTIGIESACLVGDGHTVPCVLLEVSHGVWKIQSENFFDNTQWCLQIKFGGRLVYVPLKPFVFSEIDSSGSVYIAEEDHNSAQINVMNFAFEQEIISLEKKTEDWNRRKEERYEIGADEHILSIFGFRNAEQTLIKEQIEYNCVVNNLSFQGAKVTVMRGEYKVGDEVLLCLSLLNPIQVVTTLSVVKNIKYVPLSNKQIVIVLSLFHRDASVQYKERLSKYIDRLAIS